MVDTHRDYGSVSIVSSVIADIHKIIDHKRRRLIKKNHFSHRTLNNKERQSMEK